ncbi:TonB-dependent receptor [Hymenobacter sp. RP-2-7]|uniref:TonB-dependent receptor n=1 Tax=Hymenobacter polaris TaxID=2682546 RepID=A0A7Y0AH18_9BACT|nr:TonB-dependent receptor [Hymenobacter polaris]NML67149.1 TonB-dependent receptor [Hymenobacter polaris]
MLFFSKLFVISKLFVNKCCLLGSLLACTLGLLLAAPVARAQVAPAARPSATSAPRPPADTLTTRPHRLAEARISTVRPTQFAVGSRQLVLDSTDLALGRGASLAQVLQARTPLYFKDYGPGQLASISIRGTAARHTAVLWQGLNINIPSLGEADFAILPVGGPTSVAVQPGPAAALYGSGAIGGTVLLDNTLDWRPGARGSVQADAGSFGLLGGSGTLSVAGGRVAARTAASYRTAQNDYPYTVQEAAGPVRRLLTNAVLHHQWSLTQDLALRLGQGGELTATAWLTDTDRDIQPSIYAAPTQTRELDKSRRLLLAYRHLASARRQWAVRAAWFEDVLDYQDGGATSRSLMRTTQAQAEHTSALGQRGSLRLGAEAQHYAAQIDGYGPAPITENRAAAFALLRFDPRPGLRLSGNLRQALLPGGAAPLTPTLGAEWDLGAGRRAAADSASARLTLRGSASRSYRAPTLNERYWQPGGNPNLRPETGLGYEGGLRYTYPLGPGASLVAEATAFHQLVNDWVQWTPDDRGIWSPLNLRQVRSQGLEATAAYRLRRGPYRLLARAAYSLTSTTKTQGAPGDYDPLGVQLMYVPRHQGSLVADQYWGRWLLSAQATATGRRYTDASGTANLPAYAVAGATLGYTWRLPGCDLTGLLRATNLLNQAYFGYPGRPAAPRAWQASLRLDWR